jgi:hypothetical protein
VRPGRFSPTTGRACPTRERGSATFNPRPPLPIMLSMSSPRPHNAEKPSTLSVAPSPRSVHERQRELVRASLLACPTVKSTTHRRAA